MKALSKGSVYGLRALLYIVAKKQTGFVSISEISKELDISFHFLTKTLQTLTQNGILASHRGPNGGIALAKPAEEILLIDIIKLLEGDDFFEKCLLGLPGCGSFTPCPVHDFWQVTKAAMKDEFSSTSLANLGTKMSEERLRLKP